MELPAVYAAYWPVVLTAAAALVFAVGTLAAWLLIAPRRPNAVKQEPYECGIPPLAPARIQISVKYYLVALLFLLFDMETMFILAWAVTLREPELAGARFFLIGEMLVFIAFLAIGYLYAWRKGAFEWS